MRECPECRSRMHGKTKICEICGFEIIPVKKIKKPRQPRSPVKIKKRVKTLPRQIIDIPKPEMDSERLERIAKEEKQEEYNKNRIRLDSLAIKKKPINVLKDKWKKISVKSSKLVKQIFSIVKPRNGPNDGLTPTERRIKKHTECFGKKYALEFESKYSYLYELKPDPLPIDKPRYIPAYEYTIPQCLSRKQRRERDKILKRERKVALKLNKEEYAKPRLEKKKIKKKKLNKPKPETDSERLERITKEDKRLRVENEIISQFPWDQDIKWKKIKYLPKPKKIWNKVLAVLIIILIIWLIGV